MFIDLGFVQMMAAYYGRYRLVKVVVCPVHGAYLSMRNKD